MNLVEIEEHQAGDLVFAQVYYLYIPLKATLAYVVTIGTRTFRPAYSPVMTTVL